MMAALQDAGANDGIYSASLGLELARRGVPEGGRRRGRFVAGIRLRSGGKQNRARHSSRDRGQNSRQNSIASAVDIKFDPNLPCPLKAQATIMVVER